MRIIVAIIIFFLFSACKRELKFFEITYNNTSDSSVYFYVAIRPIFYPDTILPNAKPEIDNYFFFDVGANQFKTPFYNASKKFNYNYEDSFSIFVLNQHCVEDSLWSVVRNKNLILKRYDLNFKDLDSLNWQISYP